EIPGAEWVPGSPLWPGDLVLMSLSFSPLLEERRLRPAIRRLQSNAQHSLKCIVPLANCGCGARPKLMSFAIGILTQGGSPTGTLWFTIFEVRFPCVQGGA